MKALVIVDMQHDFMPGGALPVPGGDELIPVINRIIPLFPFVVATQDWHPHDHVSFAANHEGKHVGDRMMVNGREQILWPVHCVRNSYGAELVEGLDKEQIACIFYKGSDPEIDSYSAFFDNAHLKSTGLGDYLKTHGVDEVVIVGVATDYCVFYSALDALQHGFKVIVLKDACRGIDLVTGDVECALEQMLSKGVRVLMSSDLRG
jgi:nicotinamidase/pyrazinamidase